MVGVVGVKMEYLEEWGFEMLLPDELARWQAVMNLHPQYNAHLVVNPRTCCWRHSPSQLQLDSVSLALVVSNIICLSGLCVCQICKLNRNCNDWSMLSELAYMETICQTQVSSP